MKNLYEIALPLRLIGFRSRCQLDIEGPLVLVLTMLNNMLIRSLIVHLGVTVAHQDHASGEIKCPGSSASFHAWLAIEASVASSCADAKEEVLARIAGQNDNTWDDPHGNGKYTLVSDTDAGVTADRLSSSGAYTDRVLFTFVEDGSVCRILACSESQGMSGADQSTNLCNSWNLVCTSEQECCAVVHDLKPFTYTIHSKSSGATDKLDVCLGGQGGSGGGFGGDRQTKCLLAAPESQAHEHGPEHEGTQVTTTTVEGTTVEGQVSKAGLFCASGLACWIGAVSGLLSQSRLDV